MSTTVNTAHAITAVVLLSQPFNLFRSTIYTQPSQNYTRVLRSNSTQRDISLKQSTHARNDRWHGSQESMSHLNNRPTLQVTGEKCGQSWQWWLYVGGWGPLLKTWPPAATPSTVHVMLCLNNANFQLLPPIFRWMHTTSSLQQRQRQENSSGVQALSSGPTLPPPPPSSNPSFPSPFLLPPLPSLPLPLRSRPPKIQLGSLGQRCKLPQRGLGRSLSWQTIRCILDLKFNIWWQQL